MPPKKKARFVSEREREDLLQNFLENLENEDDDEIFEKSDSESEDDEVDFEEEVDANVDVNIEPNEANENEVINEPVNTNRNTNRRRNEPVNNNNTNRNTNRRRNVNQREINRRNDDNEIELPRKVKFQSLDQITDENNFDPVVQEENEEYNYCSSDKKFKMKWFTKNNNTRNAGRQPACNVLEGPIGPLGQAKNVRTALEAFELFIKDEFLEEIVTNTNKRIENFRRRFQETLENTSKYTYCRVTDLIEIKAFIGLCYLRGAINFNTTDIEIVFHHEASHDIFSATMSKNRFKFLLQFLQFDDKDTRPARWDGDKYAAIRIFFEQVNAQNAKMRGPSTYLSVDETLYPYRGKIGIKQYNPAKPAKYGLLYRSLCDAEVPYTYYTLPYNGKPDRPDNEYYVTGTDEYTKYLVTKFLVHNKIAGRNISLDRYFTSVTLAKWCLEKRISIVGTMKIGRMGIPKEMIALTDREEKSTKYCYSEDNKILLTSYVDKKASGKKNVIVLSTMHKDVRVTRDQRKKPNNIVLYDHTKGGVDIVDLISSKLSVRMKTRRWTMNALAFILDTVRTNAKTIFREASENTPSTFKFTWDLGTQLVTPLIERRYNNPVGIGAKLFKKMAEVLKKEVAVQQNLPELPDQGKRCRICLEEIAGYENYKQNKNKLNNKVKTSCATCQHTVCIKHYVITCQKCHNPEE